MGLHQSCSYYVESSMIPKRKILTDQKFEINPSSWIGDSMNVLHNKTLKSLTFPGTHNSGSYYLKTDEIMIGDASPIWDRIYPVLVKLEKSVGAVALSWSKTQDLNFYQQMQGGIRYFDLRAGWNKTTSTWVTFHFLQGSPVAELLQNISEFLNDYPQEIVIVEISHFRGDPTEGDVRVLRNLVYGILGKVLCPVDLDFSFTVGQMVSKGQRALVTMESGFDDKYIWPPTSIYNTYADTADLPKMIQFNDTKIQEYMKGNFNQCLFKISWTLTAGDDMMLESLLPCKPRSLIELADSANKALPSFWNHIKKNQWRTGNILIIDHFESSQIMNVVWSNNNLI